MLCNGGVSTRGISDLIASRTPSPTPGKGDSGGKPSFATDIGVRQAIVDRKRKRDEEEWILLLV